MHARPTFAPFAWNWLLSSTLALASASSAHAQLGPPPAPPQNPITEEKRVLGKILFWEEQLSSDDTVACGSCHVPSRAGSAPRLAAHPGLNGLFGDLDDKLASPGVLRSDAVDDYEESAVFGFEVQVTERSANPYLMGAYAPEAFWDGRAGSTFVDPDTGNVLIPIGGALENQVLGPPVSDVEMAHAARDWSAVTAKIALAEPLALALDLPADVAAAIAAHPTYPELFEDAFGTVQVTAARIAFAIATYERTLVPNQTPWDRFIAGDNTAMTQNQINGWNTFRAQQSNCNLCHVPPVFSNQSFRNIGLRPVGEDRGRQDVTGNFGDRGRFKVPSLRNVGLKASFMHNGGVVQGPMNNVRDVIDYYIPANGHVQFPDNIDPLVPAIDIPLQARGPLADFLGNALTDPRVASESFPFDRPTLRSELGGNIELVGSGRAGSGGFVPRMIALTPPHLGSSSFKIGVHEALGGAQAWVALSLPGAMNGAGVLTRMTALTLSGSGAGEGFGTWHWSVPATAALAGRQLDLTWFVVDPQAPGGLAKSATARLTLF